MGQFLYLKACTLRILVFVNSPLCLVIVCGVCLSFIFIFIFIESGKGERTDIWYDVPWVTYFLHIVLLKVSRAGTADHSIPVKSRISPLRYHFFPLSQEVKWWLCLWTFPFSQVVFPYHLWFGWMYFNK